MIDSMHQSWLPRVVEAVFRSDGAKDRPLALLQRRQPQATTAARYLMLSPAPYLVRPPQHGPLSCFPSVSETPSAPVWSGLFWGGQSPGGWPGQDCCPTTHSPFQYLLSSDATAETALLGHPDAEP